MIQIYNNKHLTWDGTTSINHYELFADTVTDLPSDPYYFSSPDKGSYKMAQGSIAWVIDVSEIYMLDSGGTWVLESISGGGGGGGGTTNYNALTNKPSINSVELNGNKTLSDLGIQPVIDSSHKLSADNISNGTTNKFNMQADWNQADNTAGDYIKNKPTLGTAAATDATAYATAAQGTKADSAIQSVKVGGTALTPDANKAVNITSIPSSVTATTQSQKDNSTKIATTAYVDKAVDDLPEPMVWTGTITITADTSDTTKCSIVVSKPASAANIKNGFTYKIASIASSPVYTGTLKVGDTLIAAKDAPTVTSTWVDGTDWNIVPSGDEPSGTVMSVTASNGLKTASGSAITDTGDIQANLASTTALSGNTIYNVGLNSNGNLAVKVPTVSKTAVGLTPQLPNESSTTKFLRQDGSWEVPAYTTVAEGSSNGTVKVNGADVSVHGLGTAAYTASSAYATSTQGGKADTAIQSAGTGLSKSGTTLNHSNSVTAKTTQGFAQIAYDAQGHITGSTAATTAQADAINSGITSTDVAQIGLNKNNILSVADQSTQYNIAQGRTRTLDSVTSTVSGYTITFSGTSSGTSSFSFLKAFSPPKSGDYVWKSTNGVTIGGTPISVYMWDATANVGVPVTDIEGGLKVNLDSTHVYTLAFTLQANKVVTGTYSVMIISKDLWDSGITDYQPYAMSNVGLTAEVKPTAYSNPTPQSADITLQSGGYYKIGNSVTVCIRATVSNALTAWAPIFSGLPAPITDDSIAENSAVVAVTSNAGVGIGITKRGIMQGFDAIPAGTLLLNCTYLCI